MEATGATERVRSLDGLRGLAASIVVVGHLLNATVIGLSLVALGRPHHLSGLEHLLSYTPLHIIWAGQDWVVVFFVLSGFVLSLAAAGGARFNGTRYYPNRFVRLYVPVWGALIVAAIAHEAISHHVIRGATPWLNFHAIGLDAHMLSKDLTLVSGAGDGGFSSVLWSLRWEVIFSLLLPLYLLAAARLSRRLIALGALAVIFAFGARNDYARYLPTFMLGVVLAYERERVQALVRDRLAVVVVASLLALTANWWLSGFAAAHAGLALTNLGAGGLVAAGMTPGFFSRFLRTPPMQLLGRRSFSLYLVHEPLLVACAFALGGHAAFPVLALVAFPIIAVVTEVFYRLVERPSHVWARQAGALCANLLRAARGPRVQPVEQQPRL